MSISYSIATNNDFDAMYDFAMRAISDSVLPKFAEDAGMDLGDRMMNNETTTILAKDDEDIVAYTELDLSRKGAIYIRGVYVLPSHRRMGIGGKLLDMVRSEFGKNDEKIRVEAFTSDGRNFWENHRFRVSSYIMEFDG